MYSPIKQRKIITLFCYYHFCFENRIGKTPHTFSPSFLLLVFLIRRFLGERQLNPPPELLYLIAMGQAMPAHNHTLYQSQL